ncbi:MULTISPECIES: MerR family transcriptional regulator [unclassified Duganella]|jgi:MerR family copper efflux transcriptional regulator|uniref:MerR family transcriptional regulator n=1 Tax=unclassified Duganella TaxID=2636909 RepID=UPI00088F1625|nr:MULTISPECIES: MerR family transcriptional regulator [unclassified Duganella]SDG72076.1 DNA-binding transcriptional regulator, MerR family [Duganella sp. OV458]SDJ98026.1 DNA-binding transcriptional regulator, MerR family [Duganella sp. OV510]
MKIGELSRKSGIAASAIRFYEEQGLLAPVSRTASGYRQYASNAPDRLKLIQGAKKLGFTLEVIRDMLDENGKCSVEKTMRQSAILLREIEEQQAALEQRRQSLLILRANLGGYRTGDPCRDKLAVN